MPRTTTSEVIGAYADDLPQTDEHLTINFSPGFAPRKNRWRNYGLSADFLGDYFATFFPGDKVPNNPVGKQETIKGAVSFIANELLENAMKYNDESAKLPVGISLFLYDERLVFVVSNYTALEVGDAYRVYASELVTADLDELYMRRLEQAGTGDGSSQMGLLTIINDYEARMGWKFEGETGRPDLYKVSTMVQLPV